MWWPPPSPNGAGRGWTCPARRGACAARFPEPGPHVSGDARRPRPDPGLAPRRPRRPTTCAAACSPTSTAPPPCPGCGRPGKWRAAASTVPIGSLRTPSSEGMVFAVRARRRHPFGQRPTPSATGALLADPGSGPAGAGVARYRCDTALNPPGAGSGPGPGTTPSGNPDGDDGGSGRAAVRLDHVGDCGRPSSSRSGADFGEVANLLVVAMAVVAGATARMESRGGHRRSDYPSTDPAFSA